MKDCKRRQIDRDGEGKEFKVHISRERGEDEGRKEGKVKVVKDAFVDFGERENVYILGELWRSLAERCSLYLTTSLRVERA